MTRVTTARVPCPVCGELMDACPTVIDGRDSVALHRACRCNHTSEQSEIIRREAAFFVAEANGDAQ